VKLTCEYCGLEWNTTGDVHGTESCRERLRDMLRTAQQGRDNNRDSYYAVRDERDVLKGKLVKAMEEIEGWKKGVRAANTLSQRFEGENRNLQDRLHDMEMDFRHSVTKYEERVNDAEAHSKICLDELKGWTERCLEAEKALGDEKIVTKGMAEDIARLHGHMRDMRSERNELEASIDAMKTGAALRIRDLEQDLHQARSEWQEEKKRNLEMKARLTGLEK
jgi:chromosome segregation ATPase